MYDYVCCGNNRINIYGGVVAWNEGKDKKPHEACQSQTVS